MMQSAGYFVKVHRTLYRVSDEALDDVEGRPHPLTPADDAPYALSIGDDGERP